MANLRVRPRPCEYNAFNQAAMSASSNVLAASLFNAFHSIARADAVQAADRAVC